MMQQSHNPSKIQCEWGANGITALRERTDVFVIVDVLSFSTAVDIAISRQARVFPWLYKDDSAAAFAETIGAQVVARERSLTEVSLSPTSLLNLPTHSRIVLPSPNGSHLSRLTGSTLTLCGCLRNAAAVATRAMELGERITVIPAGERWEDGTTRFALEDWLGAGAVIQHLTGTRSEEANAAGETFMAVRNRLHSVLHGTISGKELEQREFGQDTELAAEFNKSSFAPVLYEGSYQSDL